MPEDLITSTKDRLGSDKVEVVIFPNPVTDKLFLQGIDYDMRIIISSVDGRKLIKKDLKSNAKAIINTSTLKSGIYFYTITDQNQTIKSGKLIKQ